MDLLCPKCGEPWDNDELHEQAEINGTSYAVEAKKFRAVGCATFDCSHNSDNVGDATEIASMIYDIMGDDMDGAASAFDDAHYLGYL